MKLLSHGPEPCASANSAIPAYVVNEDIQTTESRFRHICHRFNNYFIDNPLQRHDPNYTASMYNIADFFECVKPRLSGGVAT